MCVLADKGKSQKSETVQFNKEEKKMNEVIGSDQNFLHRTVGRKARVDLILPNAKYCIGRPGALRQRASQLNLHILEQSWASAF